MISSLHESVSLELGPALHIRHIIFPLPGIVELDTTILIPDCISAQFLSFYFVQLDTKLISSQYAKYKSISRRIATPVSLVILAKKKEKLPSSRVAISLAILEIAILARHM